MDNISKISPLYKLFHLPFLPTERAYQILQHHFRNKGRYLSMKDLFNKDENRFEKFSVRLNAGIHGEILFDYSKNFIKKSTMKHLITLARDRYLEESRDTMICGEKINVTENRAVFHFAMRGHRREYIIFNCQNILIEIRRELDHMQQLTNMVLSGKWLGATGKPLTDVVHIGIGGSILGPQIVTEALKPYRIGLRAHFVSNVDGSAMSEVLKKVDYETTLFIIASKTFAAQNTLTNANTAKAWFHKKCEKNNILWKYDFNFESIMQRHFVAVTGDRKKSIEFGIDVQNTFMYWEWVGDRFSVWSTVGLVVCLSIGYKNFEEFLDGGYFMDEHFKTSPLEKNIPVIMALLSIWYSNFFNCSTHAVLPYDRHMNRFPAYIRQLETESNGKFITRSGSKQVTYNTGYIVFGQTGASGLHCFYQLLQQGTPLIPCDFIAACRISCNMNRAKEKIHRNLLASFLAQSEGLMLGKKTDKVRPELEKLQAELNEGHENLQQELNQTKANKLPMSDKKLEMLLPHRICRGNCPSNSIVVREISPFILGAILAMYEHKVFVEGIIWDINSFERSGIEVSQEVTDELMKDLNNLDRKLHHDQSTNGLIKFLRANL